MRVHIQIPRQNRIVARLPLSCAMATCRALFRIAKAVRIGPITTSTCPTFRSAEKKSLMHCEKAKPSDVTSNSWLTVKRSSGCNVCFFLGMLMMQASTTDAHEFITTKITWAREISRVFNRRCISCHRQWRTSLRPRCLSTSAALGGGHQTGSAGAAYAPLGSDKRIRRFPRRGWVDRDGDCSHFELGGRWGSTGRSDSVAQADQGECGSVRRRQKQGRSC